MKHAKKPTRPKHYTIPAANQYDFLSIDKMENGDFVLQISGMWHNAYYVLPKSQVTRLVDILLDDVYEPEEPENWEDD